MAAVMQPPRPSMDRSASFEQARRVAPSFTAPQRPSLSQTPSHNSAASANQTHHRHSFTQNQNQHSRSSSAASNQRPSSIKQSSSPYQQPYPTHQSYFPQSQSMYSIPQQQGWTTSALPVSAFHASPFHQYANTHGHGQGGGNQVFHPGFQQSQAEFAAWAGAYQQMVAASQVPQSQGQGQGHGYGGGGGQGMFTSAPTEYLNEDHRARSVSSPTASNAYERSQSPPNTATKPPVQAFHPYKRQPGHRPSRENIANASVTGMSRSASSPIVSRPPPIEHVRNVSAEQHPPRKVERSSESSERERPVVAVAPTPTTAAPVPATRTYANAATGSGTGSRASTPLHTGPIANAAANTPSSRPSPLSNNSTPTPVEPEKKGLKGRFKKALGGDSKRSTTPAATITPPAVPVAPAPAPVPAKSSTPPSRTNTPQHYTHDVPLNPPHAPFAVANQGAMGSDVSLANTERTTTTLTGGPGQEGKEKKRSMFRMKNMSTDNISIASTVSTASMMIRRMGSIGKLARRNSLAGISKIFKEKPKDEDAALPEKAMTKAEKKQAKQDKKDRKKASAAPATVSHTTAEPDRPAHDNDEDRALAGLSPAAKLARQHTLRSKAEQAKRDRNTPPTGEPTWDNNTQTRNGAPVLPSIESLTSGLSTLSTGNGPEVVRVQPRSRQTIVHAVNVADHEYDSEDDSSDGETIEDATIGVAKARFSQDTQRSNGETDDDFKARWGSTWIDRNAVPKKGILKQYHSYTEGQQRQRSTSNAGTHLSPGPLSNIPPSNPAHIDGLAHPLPQHSRGVEFTEHLDDSPTSIGDFRPPIYQHPAHNSSEPALSLLNNAVERNRPMVQGRSMTTPASKRLEWAPECAVYSTYDAGTYDRRSEPATCNRLTPELAMAIKQELNAFKLEMPVHPQSRGYTHYFA